MALPLRSKSQQLCFVVTLAFFMLSLFAFAECSCNSNDATKACTGTSLAVTVEGGSRSITFDWAFNSAGKAASCGQFANGDYWLAPAAGESSVSVTSITGSGSGTLFVDENPVPEGMGLLSRDYGNQVASENILPSLPLSYTQDTSLVAVIERDEAAHGKCGTKAILGSCAEAYHIVTILKAVPKNAGADMLRPNITETSKEKLIWDDFDLSRLATESYFDGTDAEGIESIRQNWSHHIEILSMRDKEGDGYSEGGRAFRADLITDDYAASVARQWHNHLSTLMSDEMTLEQKKPALAAMLTYGKDIFYHVYTPSGERERWFGTGAGQSLGRFPPAVFFAAMAKDPLYANTLKLASSTQVNVGGVSIHELDQVNLGQNGPVWGDSDDLDQYDVGRYWGEMLLRQSFDGASGNYEGRTTGRKTTRDPYNLIDGPGGFPGSSYAAVSAGPIKSLAAEMLLMPEMCSIVNYDALIDYAVRITDVGLQTANDSCAPPDPREPVGVGCDTFRAKGCRYYGLSWDPEYTDAPTWGPDPVAVANGDYTQCIKNGTDPLTGEPQNGRFSSRHGSPFNIGYPTWQVENNWALIADGRNSCRVTESSIPIVLPEPPTNIRRDP